MALKFLNKKGWHTGSLRNIENVWKAEQKHNAEQKKLDELRKQIQEERERSEFRQLQEQAGLVPAQERLDFLYDSGLSVGKTSSEAFKAHEPPPQPPPTAADPSSSKSAVPGALFEDKSQSANDAWRKLHSDPLLLIRQREQQALSRIKNNPVQMAMICKSVESKTKHKEAKRQKKEHRKHHKRSKRARHSSGQSDSEGSMSDEDQEGGKRRRSVSSHHKMEKYSSEDHRAPMEDDRRKRSLHEDKYRLKEHSKISKGDKHYRSPSDSEGHTNERRERRKSYQASEQHSSGPMKESENHCARFDNHRRQQPAPKLSAEEKAARAREMKMDAELHEEQRWKRLRKASEADAHEAFQSSLPSSRNFLDAAQKSIYGTDGSAISTIEDSVRRQTFYLQGKEAIEGNAFQR